MWRMRSLFALVFLLFLAPAQAQEAPYTLHAGDVLEISVDQDPTLNRQFIVQPDGRIALPLAGHLQAAGLTLEELEKTLTDHMQKNFRESSGLTVMLVKTAAPPPQAASGTIYIVGDVNRPGAYQVSPGMTILHAVSLAGGYATASQPSGTASSPQANLAAAERELLQLVVQEARVRAELDGKQTITVPDDIPVSTDSILLGDIVRQQTLTLEVRRGNRLAEEDARAGSKLRAHDADFDVECTD